MAEEVGGRGKVVRKELDSLFIDVTKDELKYRNKYLPDPRLLSGEKIVCTVCSVSLANKVRRGKNIYIHKTLGVLVCKTCHSFYGDGVFSTDEDGDDKYCRWCGQGGTLFLCSACNCGFCKKCMTKNMKNTALAEIEKDDWRCLICVPRPIFGSRAVCWASQELNRTARKHDMFKSRLEEEKLRLEEENEDTKENEMLPINSAKKGDRSTKKRRRESQDSDSSSVFIPAKKPRENEKNKSLNGSIKKHRRKNNVVSSDNEPFDDDHTSKWEKRKRKKPSKHYSSSSNDSSVSGKIRKFTKKSKTSSGETTSSEDEKNNKFKSAESSEGKSFKIKRKNKLSRSKRGSTSDSSLFKHSENRRNKQKRHKVKKKKSLTTTLSSSDMSSVENEKNSDEEKKQAIGHKNEFNAITSCTDIEETLIGNKVNEINVKDCKPVECGTKVLCDTVTDKEIPKGVPEKVNVFEFQSTDKETFNEKHISVNDSQVLESKELENRDKENQGAQELQTFKKNLGPSLGETMDENELTLCYSGSSACSAEQLCLSQEDEIKVKVDLAIEWLDSVTSDIADLATLISERSNRFGEKKLKMESLNSYEDVITILGKLKQLLSGIHTNYKQIEDSLEDKLKSWKILTSLEKPEVDEIILDEPIQESTSPAEERIQDEEIFNLTSEPVTDVTELSLNVNSTGLLVKDEIPSNVLEVQSVAENKEKETDAVKDCKQMDIETHSDVNKNEIELSEVGEQPISSQNYGMVLNEIENLNEAIIGQTLQNEDINNAIVKATLNLESGSTNRVWSGLLSSDEDSEFNGGIASVPMLHNDNDKLPKDDQGANNITENTSTVNVDTISGHKEVQNADKLVDDKEAENFEALQELLYSSTEEEESKSSESESDDSDEIQLDDSDLDNLLKPRKIIIKKQKKKEIKREETNEDCKVKIEDEEETNQKIKEAEQKAEVVLDSEAEIDMLTDLSKLKKKTILRRTDPQQSSEKSSSEDSQNDDDDDEDQNEDKKKRKKYNTVIKKNREEKRKELLGFLHGDSSAEGEADITKDDLDVMEDNYATDSSDSMSLEAFSRKMNEKYRELEQQQDHMNLQRLLASESDEGSAAGDDVGLDSGGENKKNKAKKIKEEKIDKDEVGEEKDHTDVKENKDEAEEDKVEANKNEEIKVEENSQLEDDEEYKQFEEEISKARTTFTGLGSSSEGDEIDIKDQLLSDSDTKIKKEPYDRDGDDSSNSDSSSDVFLDLTKRKSGKKSWRHHRLLKMKLSDTDTSDEDRWWNRRMEREKNKKDQGDGSKRDGGTIKADKIGSDKENNSVTKKVKKEKEKEKEDDASSSSTLEMSSTESSGSEVFKKKKKKKKQSSDSDVIAISDLDKKKKKKRKKMNLSGDSSDESEESGDDVIDITQKSSQGESPGKGGRKNIRKVLTKHELAAATKAAAKEEEERKKRIAARQKLFNEMFEIKEAEVLEKLVLDFDPETKTELISVDKDLVTKMKPHQAKGVKFMWDSCFESLSQLKTKKGSGCILAHCMGLGKTFQVVSLVHTILKHKDTNVNTVLVVCPLSTVLNWYSEFDKWLEGISGGKDIEIYHLTKFRRAHERAKQLALWHRTGGVMILGYEMFRILTNPNTKKFRLQQMDIYKKTLVDPGADLVVCDEGHMLKNESTVLSKAMSRIRTLRRIVLTGTPMQNNLKEYHCMVQFVKPNLLGTRKEFLNQFVNPITNGQFVDSTEADVKVMKRRAHVLHKMLEGLVQRCDYSVLMPFLPPKHEYVISLRLSDVQVKLYQFYLDHFSQNSNNTRTGSQLFQDWQALGRIWTHPRVLKMSTDKAEKEREKHDSSESDSEKRNLRSQKSITDFFKKKGSTSPSECTKQESEDERSVKGSTKDKSSASSLILSSSHSSSSSDEENGGKKNKEKKIKNKEESNKNEPDKKEIIVVEAPVVDLVDEVNLISSEEEDEVKKEEMNPVELGQVEKDQVEKDQVEDNLQTECNNENVDNKANDDINENGEAKPVDETKAEEENQVPTDQKSEKEEEKQQENVEEKSEEEGKKKVEEKQLDRRGSWWKDIIEPQHLEDINQSAKLILLFAILRECEMIEDKVLVFSQSLFSLDLIEFFLEKVDRAMEENRLDESLGNHAGCWQKGLDYYRLDGSSNSENRSIWCKSFNREDNPRARLFLISTRAGGLGINLTAANRVVIFDASWNPSHDVQSIFRIYRFGQKKPCYVYRFIAHGTMEEKVYDRQVAKQSLSSRVVDEQQVHRHFSMNDLNELYTFTPPQDKADKPTPALPKDRLMAELLTQYKDWIEKYHEHDSLLENIAEEELNEEERKLAWEDYENEKKQVTLPVALNSGASSNFPGGTNQIELFRKSLRLKFPNATDAEMNAMLQTLMYQVNSRVMSQQIGGPQQQGQQGAGPSQEARQQQSYRGMNKQQVFNAQRNLLYQKYGAEATSNQRLQQQRIGNGPINQQRMSNAQLTAQRMANLQMSQNRVGNGQIKQQNQAKTVQQNYMEMMRKQQEANLARIQNQKRIQQMTQQTNIRQQPTQQTNPRQQPIQQTNPRQQPIQRTNVRQQPVQQPTQRTNIRQQPVQQINTMNQARMNRVMTQGIPNRQQPQSQLRQTPGMWKNANQNRLQQVQKNPINMLNNRRQLQVTPISNVANAIPKNSQQVQWKNPPTKTAQQLQQEQMRQRISLLQRQRQNSLQQNSSSAPKNALDAAAQKRQLEEMKKRYKASRMKPQTAGDEIVEIDDEPT